METPLAHRDDPGELFIRTSMFLLALMNSAPAELLHLLVHAALQPSLTIFIAALLPQQSKKRRQSCRHRNSVQIKRNHFSKKKPPCPTVSGKAAKTDEIDLLVYCPLNLVSAFLLCSLVFSP